MQDDPKPKYVYQRYPLVMHRGQYPDIQSVHVSGEEQEKEYAAKGWSSQRPAVPEQTEKPVLTLEERVTALEEGFNTVAQNIQAMTELLAELTKQKTGRSK